MLITRESPTESPVHDNPVVGAPVTFSDGLLAGQRLRFELEEIQGAAIGRKYVGSSTVGPPLRLAHSKLGANCRFTRKDRRPIDPPPVVVCKVFQSVTAEDGEVAKEEVTDYKCVQQPVLWVILADQAHLKHRILQSRLRLPHRPFLGLTTCATVNLKRIFNSGVRYSQRPVFLSYERAPLI